MDSGPEIERATGEVSWGPDVSGRIGSLTAGVDVKVGVPTVESFRRVAGVRIDVDELVLGDGVSIERECSLRGRRIVLRAGVRVRAGTTIHAVDSLEIGAGGTIGEECELTIYRGSIGRQLWMLPAAKIGGGSATDIDSELIAGPWLHLGTHTLLNTAKRITLGREVGLGTRTSLYTHGAYPSMLAGFPVSFAPITVGDHTWIPGATVNPGVSIGANCVIGVNSLVTRDIPSGSLAGGTPAKVIQENAYPKTLSDEACDAKVRAFLRDYAHLLTDRHTVSIHETPNEARIDLDRGRVQLVWSIANVQSPVENEIRLGRVASGGRLNLSLDAKQLEGAEDRDGARLINQLRRWGVRFDYEAVHGVYRPWSD